jgi:SAM-dependent methyltransferase
MGEPNFRRDLYRGTARDYDEFRVPYPAAMIGDLRSRAGLDGTGRLLDLACGTGQITFSMHDDFDDVWAVDQEQDAVELGRAKAEQQGLQNVRWIAMAAESLDAPEGFFRLVAIGNAFHRLPRQLVARRVRRWLAPGGYLALLWSSAPWTGHADWQEALGRAIRDWKAEAQTTDRVPPGLNEDLARHPNASVLEEAGFLMIGKYRFPTAHEWTLQALIGHLYSTSFLSREALGHHRERFEADLRGRLLECKPAGVFAETIDFAYELALVPR